MFIGPSQRHLSLDVIIILSDINETSYTVRTKSSTTADSTARPILVPIKSSYATSC